MQFTLKAQFKATAKEIYEAWLDSKSHSLMAGGEAQVSNQEGGSFTAWDGYIQGKNLELQAHRRILQAWRTTQFEEEEEDSLLEILLEEQHGITELTLIHSKLSENGGHYLEGWKNHYFTPMKAFFNK